MGIYSPVIRDSDGKTIRLDKQEAEQADTDAKAKRVILVDESGNPINSSNPTPTEPGAISGRTFKYEDTSFVSGDSPVTLDVNTDLGRNSVDGYITCDGPGNILVEISDDGSSFGGQHTLKVEETISLTNLNVDKIKITHSGTDSAYRILVV